MGLTLDSVLVLGEQQVSCEIRGDVVILNTRDGVYYGLEGVASRVWQLLEKPESVGCVRDEIVAEFDVAPDRCAEDLLAFLQHLLERGLMCLAKVTEPTQLPEPMTSSTGEPPVGN